MSTFLERFKTFAASLGDYIKSGGKLVDQNTANIRAEICVKCHNNVIEKEARKTCCGGGIVESAVIVSTRAAIVGSRKTTSDKSLATCAICGCCNKTSVWFPSSPIGVSQDNKNAYPDFCWKKQIFNFDNK